MALAPRGRPPSNRITRADREDLPPGDEKEVVGALVAEVLSQHQMGITVPLMAEKASIAASTARFHLEHLVAVGEAYKLEVGARSISYLPNGRLTHPLSEEPIQLGDKHYSFKLVRNAFGEFYLLQERQRDPWGVWKTVGGVAVQKKALRQLAAKLERIADQENIPKDTGVTQ